MTTTPLTVPELRALLTSLGQTTPYDDATLQAMLPHVENYRRSRETLRQLPLGEVGAATSLLAGGKP